MMRPWSKGISSRRREMVVCRTSGRSSEERTAWRMAVRELEVRVAKAKKAKSTVSTVEVGLLDVVGQVTYGFDRLVDTYWKPMHTGKNVQDGSSLPMPGFPAVLTGSIPPDKCVFSVARGGAESHYDLGPPSQCGFLFIHNRITLTGIDSAGNIIIKDRERGNSIRTVTRAGEEIP